MEKVNVDKVILNFIEDMKYLENEHVLGCFFYGSFLTGYYNNNSDIDLHIIFDDFEPERLIRGNKHIDGMRIEYFEKPIGDLYLSINTEFNNQNNALLSILGTSRIIFDKNGDLKKLQQYALTKFSNPLPPLEEEDAREYVSILNNRIEKLEKACLDDNPYFYHLYHLTIEKIRKFIGPPLKFSYMEYYGMTAEQAEEAIVRYREYYTAQGIFDNSVYDGVISMLEALKNAGKTLAIATSKPEKFANMIAEHFDFAKY